MVVGDIMNIVNFIFSWNWCNRCGVQGIFNVIKEILNIIRIIVPIALIVMTTIDVTKKVINPEDKDGQKKIMTRAIAALIVFLIPTFIRITFKVIDWGLGNTGTGTYDKANAGLSQCWNGGGSCVD